MMLVAPSGKEARGISFLVNVSRDCRVREEEQEEELETTAAAR
jgi:hypothetical protein